MGTRGFIGFVADSTEKIAYNHFDSYPSGLGLDMLKWLRVASGSMTALRERVVELRVVDPESTPSPEDVERLLKFADVRVGSQSVDDWYVLLRHTQGEPHAMLEAGVIEDASTFPRDSLFAEWGYVVDLDANAFEAYQGFQKTQPGSGRFKDRERVLNPRGDVSEYYPVALAASWPLDKLPTDEEFITALDDGGA